jgi:hypothetical protein
MNPTLAYELFYMGLDTYDISVKAGIAEYDVYNALGQRLPRNTRKRAS